MDYPAQRFAAWPKTNLRDESALYQGEESEWFTNWLVFSNMLTNYS